MMIGLFALTVAAVFTGAAIYVNAVEQPARLTLDDRALLAEWKPAYKRGFAMQAPLAVIGFLLGLIAWWQTSQQGFLIGAIAMIAPWPWTLAAMMAVNNHLLETELDRAGPGSRALIVRWATLHTVRTGLGAIGTAAFLWALMTR
jgi:hypothetical protein